MTFPCFTQNFFDEIVSETNTIYRYVITRNNREYKSILVL